uniref:Importin N-terminal domain-containing protein n=1 Tax=Glossina palpalis gambiensis TaxID=67801 RepID=A0A1B0BK77_9MUSC
MITKFCYSVFILKGCIITAFKNYIKRNWAAREVGFNHLDGDSDGPDKIYSKDREVIKKLIVNLMLLSAPALQKQLSDAVNNW